MKTIDWVLTVLLVIVSVPLSLWGGAERWAGPTDSLPLLLIGAALIYLTFEGIRVRSAGLAVGLGILLGVAQYVPSLFLFDEMSILVLIAGYAAYSLIVYGVASAVRRGRAQQEEEDAHQDELTQLRRRRELLEEELAIKELKLEDALSEQEAGRDTQSDEAQATSPPTKLKTVYSFIAATEMLDLETPRGKSMVEQIFPYACDQLRQENTEFEQLYLQVERENTPHVQGTGMASSSDGFLEAFSAWLGSAGIELAADREKKVSVFSGDAQMPEDGTSFSWCVLFYFDLEE